MKKKLYPGEFWYGKQIDILKFSKELWDEWETTRKRKEKFSPVEVMKLLWKHSYDT